MRDVPLSLADGLRSLKCCGSRPSRPSPGPLGKDEITFMMTWGWARVVVKEWASSQESWVVRVWEGALFWDGGSYIIHLRCASLCTMLYVYSCPLRSLQVHCITSTSLKVRVLNICSQWHTCDRDMMAMWEEGSRLKACVKADRAYIPSSSSVALFLLPLPWAVFSNQAVSS